ncbi:MAG: hypothetical protein LBF85_08110 [Tannerella sp.]|nr:hypothetical protein [Tannerella sp.]
MTGPDSFIPLATAKMPLLSAMASGVIAGREATWQSRPVHHPGLPRLTARSCSPRQGVRTPLRALPVRAVLYSDTR